ncbi:nitrite reductase large subunit NirB [Niallia sp. 01092]|uniref:nitrite reductase large subunit NirB n=1 Tax=unclassified Niallia TaxID=2837522 RepID=UPI003FD30B9D
MNKQKLVVIGNGMAGVRCIEEIIKNDPETFQITIIGSEPHTNYNRILLSSVLQGDTSIQDIILNNDKWYEENNIKLFSGEAAIKVDTDKRYVLTDKQRKIAYDKLIFATGSLPFVLPLPGIQKEGVITFRTIEDCEKIIESSNKYKKAIVIGGGILGLEAARGLLNLGMQVDIVHNANFLMQRQLDHTASKLLQKELELQGMNFLLGKDSEEILGSARVEGIRFKDGTEAKADLIVMAVGVIPNIQLAKDSGIETNRAIVVNDYLETNISNIYAVGECVEHRGIVYGLVKPLYEQGQVLAKRICGINGEGYKSSTLSTKLKISGLDVFSVGKVYEDDTTQVIKMYDEVDGIYKKILFEDDKLVGAILFGDTRQGTKILDMVIKKKDMHQQEKNALFQMNADGLDSFAAMPQSEMICNCNGVTKGAIIEAVQQKNLTTVEEVKQCTKASGSCGGCKPLVEDLLLYIQSDDFDEKIEKKSMCTCTSLTEEEVVHEMQAQNLISVPDVMSALNWKNHNGCSVCNPALHYYLGMIYPEYESLQEIFYVNEKMNAIAQSDGTYTIIPQMYGGITSGAQLTKIGEVITKYKINDVAVTSEQRIHLMGVPKEQVFDVCKDLDMPLSSTFGNTVHHIKTCIGEHICKCDKQKSLQLGVQLEKQTELIITPYRVKMGISACLHNGAGSTTKDIGVIGVDRGWEIYVGGSSGRNVRSGELLCVAATEEEVVEMITGFIQYYRETANYLERTWQWIERVNLVHIREVLFEKDLRKQLISRLNMDIQQRKKQVEKSFS